ncbi:non-specific lipid transfer protein GPI-anchored 15-like [Lolium perenne]|uniref:non-specific lipid transfer protein GPI-anchored 15-like n=1 Tax=Lolium perenne TaxID=4522 RepID=UPI0021F609A1|nr:non-specific lipid transfer protein GPI-anchored 15-like [Lolium perenne]
MATMAASVTAFCVALLLLVSIPGAHPAPVPQTTGPSTSSCTTELFRLLPCLSFLDGASAAPADTCCANLGSMVHDEPLCLCQALNQSGPERPPVNVNMSRVVELPLLCRLDLPTTAAACAGLLPTGPASTPPVSMPHPSANSTVPSTPRPVPPTPPLTTVSPSTTNLASGYSSGSKLIAGALSVALGFIALASALAF